MSVTQSLPHAVSRLNALVRGEVAALESYDLALAGVREEPAASTVRRLRAEHRDALDRLQDEVRREGGWPDAASGWWGAFAQAYEGTALLFGAQAALRGLLKGEEHGAARYRRALDDEQLPETARALLRDDLLPRTEAHVRSLKALLGRE